MNRLVSTRVGLTYHPASDQRTANQSQINALLQSLNLSRKHEIFLYILVLAGSGTSEVPGGVVGAAAPT